jgi:hypothetical protein
MKDGGIDAGTGACTDRECKRRRLEADVPGHMMVRHARTWPGEHGQSGRIQLESGKTPRKGRGGVTKCRRACVSRQKHQDRPRPDADMLAERRRAGEQEGERKQKKRPAGLHQRIPSVILTRAKKATT